MNSLTIFLLLCLMSFSAVADNTAKKIWSVKATVINPTLSPSSIMLEHEEIKGLMPAMTMPFGLESPEDVSEIDFGDKVQVEFYEKNNHFFIKKITALESPDNEINLPSARTKIKSNNSFSLPVVPWDRELVDQHGNNFALSEHRHKTLVINFIYTRCPVLCPIQTANLNAVHKHLTSEQKNKLVFISISLDPQHDNPKQLTEYADNHKINDSSWLFATGDAENIERTMNSFNILKHAQGETEFEHNSNVFLIADRGNTLTVLDGFSSDLSTKLLTHISPSMRAVK